jgi:ERCC4-type nuclease
MRVIVDSYEGKKLAEKMDAELQPLKEGDIHIIGSERTIVIERKTWNDAYTSWQTKRLENQISNMVEKHDDCILLIEGRLQNSRLWRQRKYALVRMLQRFLNRMSAEVLPVVYTDSKNDTINYVESLKTRLESGDYKTMIRKTVVLKSSRNIYHNIMSLIPGITIERSKKLYDHFDNLSDFVNNFETAKETDNSKRWHTQCEKIKKVIDTKWETTTDREVIVDKGDIDD